MKKRTEVKTLQVQKAFTTEDLLEMMRRKAASIPYERVYYALKLMRVKPLFPQTVETMRFCLAAHQQGLRVTVPLLSALRKREQNVVTSALHILGDKKCLTLLRGSKKACLQWIVSPAFLDHYNGGQQL